MSAEREIGCYQKVPLHEVREQSTEWRTLTLELASAEAADISHALEQLAHSDLDDRNAGIAKAELIERLEWLMALTASIKVVNYSDSARSSHNDFKSIETVQTDLL